MQVYLVRVFIMRNPWESVSKIRLAQRQQVPRRYCWVSALLPWAWSHFNSTAQVKAIESPYLERQSINLEIK